MQVRKLASSIHPANQRVSLGQGKFHRDSESISQAQLTKSHWDRVLKSLDSSATDAQPSVSSPAASPKMKSQGYPAPVNVPMMTPETAVTRSPHNSFTTPRTFPSASANSSANMAPKHLAGQAMPMAHNAIEARTTSPINRPVPPPIMIPAQNMAVEELKKAQGSCHQN
jgi:hypothetical protein